MGNQFGQQSISGMKLYCINLSALEIHHVKQGIKRQIVYESGPSIGCVALIVKGLINKTGSPWEWSTYGMYCLNGDEIY